MKKLVFLAVTFGLIALWMEARKGTAEPWPSPPRTEQRDGQRTLSRSDIMRTWGKPASLPDHFARHGHDFGARNADEYALMATQFLHRARLAGYPAKIHGKGVLRIFDPASRTFGAYNPDGTTKTFFKVRDPTYFDRQPGRTIDLRSGR